MPLPAPGAEPGAWLSLHLIAGLGAESIRRLLRQFGSPQAVLSQPPALLAQFVAPKVATAIADGASEEKLAAAMRWLARVVPPALVVSPGTMCVFKRHPASLEAVYNRTYWVL